MGEEVEREGRGQVAKGFMGSSLRLLGRGGTESVLHL